MSQLIGNYRYSDPTPFERLVRGALYTHIGISIIAIISSVLQYLLFKEVAGGYYNETDVIIRAETGHMREMMIGVGQGIIVVVAAILVLRWVYRVAANNWALSSFEMEFTPGWAVGWYFIPIANFFKPYNAMKEIWRENIEEEGATPSKQSNLPLWWTLWLATGALVNIAMRMTDSENLNTLVMGTQISILGDAVGIALDLVFLSIVSRVTTAQVERYENGEDEVEIGDASAAQIAWE